MASRIVGLTGWARSGKDTVANVLIREAGYTRVAFADGVRSMALAIDPLLHGNVHLSSVIRVVGWDKAKETIPEVRRLLQVIGTEGVRDHIGVDSWVMVGKKKIDEISGPVVVTDCRFPNEAYAIKAWGGTLIRVIRINPDGSWFDNGLSETHPSEAYVSSIPVDYSIYASSVDELEDSVRRLLTRLSSCGSLRGIEETQGDAMTESRPNLWPPCRGDIWRTAYGDDYVALVRWNGQLVLTATGEDGDIRLQDEFLILKPSLQYRRET